jgi:phosphatidylserine decarboxylase
MRFSIFLQYALPHRFLSRLVYWATRWTPRPWKNFLINRIVKSFDVDMSEAAESDVQAYEHFNAFFTRALKPGARSAAAGTNTVLCPADGRISQLGPIRDGRIFQAKGQDYTTAELLADADAAQPYADGLFVTVYLSPRDYHRVHMPLTGTLLETVHVPGRLFSVAPFPVANIPRLFARNERLVCHFEGEHGPFVVVMVGALLVSSVSTVWGGLAIPAYASKVKRVDYRGQGIRLERFAEMARFNMGSTVIVLLPRTAQFDSTLAAEQPVRMGQRLGDITG